MRWFFSFCDYTHKTSPWTHVRHLSNHDAFLYVQFSLPWFVLHETNLKPAGSGDTDSDNLSTERFTTKSIV